MRLGAMIGTCGVALAASVGAASADAAPVTFDLVSVGVSHNQTPPGLTVGVNLLDPPAAFTLDEGESFTFDLFEVFSTNFQGFSQDLFDAMPLEVTLGFDGLQGAFVQGSTALSQGGIYGVASFPSGPVTVIDGGLVYTVTLSEATFLAGQITTFVAVDGNPFVGVVQATIARPAGTVIPSPAAAGAGLALLAGAALRRRRA